MVFENKMQPAACGESHRRQSVDGLRFNLLQSRLLSKNPTDGSRWDSSESPLPCRLDFKYPPTAVGGIGVELLHLFFKDHKRRAKFKAPLRGGNRSGSHCKAWRLKLNKSKARRLIIERRRRLWRRR